MPQFLPHTLSTAAQTGSLQHLLFLHSGFSLIKPGSLPESKRLRRKVSFFIRLFYADNTPGRHSVAEYWPLSYLSEFPVSDIKIERMFVGSMNEEKRLRSIFSFTINLAHDLDMHVVAEGPEDAATLDSLRDYGCDFSQGHV